MVSAQANELLRIVPISHSSPKLEALYDLHVRMRAHWVETQGTFNG